jgi:hypothetical protein
MDTPFDQMIPFVEQCENSKDFLLSHEGMPLDSSNAEVKAICEAVHTFGFQNIRLTGHLKDEPEAYIITPYGEILLEVTSVGVQTQSTMNCSNAFENHYRNISEVIADDHRITLSIEDEDSRPDHIEFIEIKKVIFESKHTDLIMKSTSFGGFMYYREDLYSHNIFDRSELTITFDSNGGSIVGPNLMPTTGKIINRIVKKKKQHQELRREGKPLLTYIMVHTTPNGLDSLDTTDIHRVIGDNDILVLSTALLFTSGQYRDMKRTLKGNSAPPIELLQNPILQSY